VNAIYDEFKIHKVALSSSEIMNEYKISSNNGKSLCLYLGLNLIKITKLDPLAILP